MEYGILCIFTHHGKTFTFRNVEIVVNNESMIVFNYSAMSDGRQKTATFHHGNFCGYSLTPKED